MKITTKEVRNTAGMLDDIIENYKKEKEKKKAKRDWRTYEQQLAQRIKTAMKELEPQIDEAISTIHIVKADPRGRKHELTVKQRTILLLLKHLFGKSNREMSFMVVVFSLLSGIDVSYKSIERLYSDYEVIMVIHNMHILLLKKKNVHEADCCGDGTGYSLTIKKHYATVAQKLKDKTKNVKTQNGKKGSNKKKTKRVFIYSFAFMDLDTRLYIGYGTSFHSEKEAYNRAFRMITSLGISIDSIRLDRYYSGQKCVELLESGFGKNVKVYLIPKTNATIGGTWKWKRMLYSFVNHTDDYLTEYFRRNQSESGFSEDKRRFGWRIAQRREDRVDTAAFCTIIWHNLFWIGR